ncbi:hypothetical protein [Brachyspira alvinipulli]|uniref:hypothetical protein n=1 Tax=Brachyspira alvinipulli TaxID=84379 RepID=UPI0004869A82|nr:hypothetical protein [Brachyspira alvinipulli]
MTKKTLFILFIMAIVSVSAFAYSSYDSYDSSDSYDSRKSIAVITFQGPNDMDNVSLSNLFAIELGNYKDIIVRSGKFIDSSFQDKDRDRDQNEYYSSLYSSNYEYSAIKIAKELRSNYVLIGQINKLGKTHKLIVRVIDTDGNHIAGSQNTFENISDLSDLIPSMCQKIIEKINNSNS